MSETLIAPAKLTKYLKVTGTRPDGMHEIQSEMVSLSFGDLLEVGEGQGLEIVDDIGSLAGLGRDLCEIPAGESNLISMALDLLGRSADVRLLKRVPPGSGLGGGSSDAAAILRRFAGDASFRLATFLGADVSFCVNGGRAIATGVGENLENLDFRYERFVLLLSPFGVSTKEVYRRFDLMGGSIDGEVNDLEKAAQFQEPRLIKSKQVLRELSGMDPVLAGSGSTYFINGSFSQLGLESRPKSADSFRYVDMKIEGTRYRLVETSTIPRYS